MKDRTVELLRIPAAELRGDPRNWRRHPEGQRKALAAVLADVGFAGAVMARRDASGRLVLVDGHLRLESVAPETELPVLVLDVDETEAAKILATYDPLSAMAEGDPDSFKALRTQLDGQEGELGALLDRIAASLGVSEAAAAVAEQAPEPEEEARAEVGDVIVLGAHRLVCGDATKSEDLCRLVVGAASPAVAAPLLAGCALLLTDPPYGIGIVKAGEIGRPAPFGGTGRKKGAIGGRGGYRDGGGFRVTPGGPVVATGSYKSIVNDDRPFDPRPLLSLGKDQVIFGANYFASRLPDGRSWIVWDKDASGDFSSCELAWTSKTGRLRLYRHVWSGLRREGSRDVELTKRVHPTQKPVGLFAAILKDFSAPGDTVIDPYLGSGTTLIACEQQGRRCFGMEIEPAYVDVAVRRWQTFTGRKAEGWRGNQ